MKEMCPVRHAVAVRNHFVRRVLIGVWAKVPGKHGDLRPDCPNPRRHQRSHLWFCN